MNPASRLTDLVVGICPLAKTNPRLTAEVCRAGGLGVLDLDPADRRARDAVALTARWTPGPFGVRIGAAATSLISPSDLPEQVDTVVLGAGSPWQIGDLARSRRVLVEVTKVDEALNARRAGAHGLIAQGNECGGAVGELSTFVLLQRLLGDEDVDLPVWAAGGIGPHTAAAAVIGGAAGVVLDVQFALYAEAGLAAEVTSVIDGMDGSETVVEDGVRMLRRRAPQEVTLPVGQDGFLARRFADRWSTVSAAVRGIRDAILEVTPGAGDTLLPGSPAATSLGTALPVAQGPMTRVSDQASFASAVADGGGLPFVALALAGAAQTRTLLEQTRDLLGERPWGVGVLGFAPEETRTAQLEVIREVRPSHVIVAGGRPAQAAALEADGIATFLHVPSPGLLGQFLRGGARRFVFEGAECGGHVGPRASFPLWEAQIAVLEDFLDDHGTSPVQVLFAGGVHDERSAAMVATLARGLTARGVDVGVLMGTAYLFTEEAVREGAVLPLFQRQVLAARSTALLETAPGHATRCVLSPFTEEYAAIKADLRASGVPDRESWERLEQLNVGRLRLASKGIERVGDELNEVDEDRQRTEGMFMAGEVAVLRSEVTTVAALHEAVSTGAAGFLASRAEAVGQARAEPIGEQAPPPLDVAVVGMSCMFPEAANLGDFWANVLGGVDAVTEVPDRRWNQEIYYSSESDSDRSRDRSLSKWGGFLPEIPFDPLGFGIPPASLASIEPVQLLALESARRALEDAGYAAVSSSSYRDFDRTRASVVFGAEAGSDLSNATTLRTVLPSYLGELPEPLRAQLPELTEDSFPGMLANVISGRIANRLDLGGANYTVDAACASSLAAVDVACKELVGGTSDLVLCGGADLHNGINDYLLFSSVHALSPTGRSRTFDDSADGIALGEGVACVVLKRLADAERDGDRIYAVIKGVGTASDGRALGLTAPRPEGQRSALDRAYRNARISPAEVGLVEAHGTGTVVGDRTELSTLTDVFTEAGAGRGTCSLGSVKSQIGHTKCAAGLAGLIKVAMALHTGVKPPTLHLAKPNPAWDPETSPFAFDTAARPWVEEPARRVAGVSAFGFGGTNFHAVLTAHDGTPPPSQTLDRWPAELFLFRGTDRAAAVSEAERLLTLADNGSWRLRDLALSASNRADTRTDPVWIAVVAGDLDELRTNLRAALAGEHNPRSGVLLAAQEQLDHSGGKLAFLFPGQGSQRPGMLAELFVAFPELHRYPLLGRQWTDVLYPPAAFDPDTRDRQAAGITDTRVAQPALGVAGLAVHDLLTRAGVQPDMVAGHSYGELVALAAAGALDPSTLLALSSARAAAILAAAGDDPGTMAAVSADASDVDEALRTAGLADAVVTANRNSPKQTVISGATEAVVTAVEQLRSAGFGAKRIPVACAFHSPLVAAAGPRFAEVLGGVRVWEPEIPVWSNRTASVYSGQPEDVRAELAAQIGAPVRFADEIEAMYAAGARVFVEAGPGSVLTKLVSVVLGDRPHQTIAVEDRPGAGLRGFLQALARLATAGVDVRTGWLFHGRDAVDAARSTPPKPAGWTVDGQLVRSRDGEIPAGALRPAQRVDLIMEDRVHGHNGSSGSEALVAEFLRTSREMVAAQRDVMLSYFGTTAGVPSIAAPLPVLPVLPEIPAAAPATVATVQPAPEPVPAAAPEVLDQAGVLRAVLEVIGERTGYPTDMVEPDLDLEADLSVDSIKRAEIAGELATRLGLPVGDDDQVAVLSKARTAAAIAELLASQLGDEEADTPEPEEPAAPAAEEPAVTAPRRFVLSETDLPAAAQGESLSGRRFQLIVGDGDTPDPLVGKISGRLSEHGATVTTASESGVDGVLVLDGFGSGTQDSFLPDAFPVLKDALTKSPRWLVVAHPADAGPRWDGLRGFVRSAAREYPDTMVRAIEIEDWCDTASAVVGELLAGGTDPVVRCGPNGRRGFELTEADLGLLATSGAGPAGDGAAEAAAIGLDRESVVLLVGGARGITARFAETLAAASRCRIELVGRTQVTDEDELAGVEPAGLRAALVARGMRAAPEIERRVAAILAEREVRATLAALTDAGATVRYHALDVRDIESVRRLVKDVYAEYGRLDGVVHAAGVIEDKLLAEKDEDSFRRVFETKVDGARVLLDAVRDLPAEPGFAVLFGSIAAALGNRGQTDYAAANDALESIGRRWAKPGRRGLTVHWGPWAPGATHTGMVSPELMRSYTRRGIKLIDQEEGALSLLRELAWGAESVPSVVYTASGW